MTRNQIIEKLVAPFAPVPNGDSGDYILQVLALRETREMLLEKYDESEPDLWKSLTPGLHRRKLQDLRDARQRANSLRERMAKRGYSESEIHRRIWLNAGRSRTARYNRIKPLSDESIIRRKTNRLFK